MVSPRVWILLCAVTLVVAGAPAAHAMPQDPPTQATSPADGATIPAGAAPITVTYTCPAYTSDAFGNTGVPGDYDVSFSRTPALDGEGQLAARSMGVGVPTANPDGTCTSTLDTAGGSDMPRQTGGRVYWQVQRSCIGCGGASQYVELGTVQSFTVAVAAVSPTAASASLTAPKLYAGYRQVFTLRTKAEFAGSTVELQRRSGGRWVKVADEQFSETTSFVAALPAGRQELRAVVKGAGSVTLAARTVTVARSGRRTTSRRDDGAYALPGKSKNLLELRVTGGGKSVTRFRATVTTQCLQPNGMYTFTTTPVAVSTTKVAPDGSVVGGLRRPSGAETRLIGRLHRNRFRGTIFVAVGSCFGTRAISIVRK